MAAAAAGSGAGADVSSGATGGNGVAVGPKLEVLSGGIRRWTGVFASGSHYALLAPASNSAWNGRVLIHAHGCRPVGIPLVADLDAGDELYSTLLRAGWAVGMPSYRRQGLIVRDAMADVDDVRAFAAATLGAAPTTCIVEGESMGGAIGTFLSERAAADPSAPQYHGMLLIGAALLVREPATAPFTQPLRFTHRARVPLLYLNTSDEVDEVDRYARRCMSRATMPDSPPPGAGGAATAKPLRKPFVYDLNPTPSPTAAETNAGPSAAVAERKVGLGTRAKALYGDSDHEASDPDVSDEDASNWEGHPFHPAHYGGATPIAHWYVRRNGHCNVNGVERLRALTALLRWIGDAKGVPTDADAAVAAAIAAAKKALAPATADAKAAAPTPAAAAADAKAAAPVAATAVPGTAAVGEVVRCVDATIPVVVDPTSTRVAYDDGGAWGHVTACDAWGDVMTDVTPAALRKLGIAHGRTFTCVLGGQRFKQPGKAFKVVFGGNSYLSVSQGSWYAYEHANGFIAFSANGYAHPHLVTAEAGVSVGSSVYIEKPVGVGAGLKGIPNPQNDKNMLRLKAEQQQQAAVAAAAAAAGAAAGAGAAAPAASK